MRQESLCWTRIRWIHRLGRFAVVAIAGCLLHAAAVAQQQFPTPRLATISPPGGKIGTTFEITVTGSDLDGVEQIIFSHPGIKAERIPTPPPKPDPKKKDAKNKPPAKKPEPFLPNKFKVTIGGNVPVGVYIETR